MIDADSPLGLFLSVSPVVTCLMAFSFPGMSIWTIHKNKTTGLFPLATFYIMAVQCAIWCTYGFLEDSYTVYLPNSIGLVLGLIYTAVYLHYYTLPASNLMPQMMVGVVTLVGLIIVYSTVENPAKYFGLVGAVGSIMFAGSPLVAIVTVMKTKSLASMPFHTSFILFLNAMLWSMFGILVQDDPAIYVPNLVGFLAGTLQVLVHLYFYVAVPRLTHSPITQEDEVEHLV